MSKRNKIKHQRPWQLSELHQYLLVALSALGKDLQPERLEQSHADYVLTFVADCDVVEEDPFEFETKPAIEIDVAHVDVTRVDVNLVQVPDHERIVKKAECCLLSDSFALQARFAYQLFHLKFTGRRVDVLTADNSDRLVVVIDAEIFSRRLAEILLQLAFIFRKCRDEAFTHGLIFEPAGDLAYDLALQRTKRHVLNCELLALRPFVFHRRQRKDSVVISYVFVRFLFLR